MTMKNASELLYNNRLFVPGIAINACEKAPIHAILLGKAVIASRGPHQMSDKKFCKLSDSVLADLSNSMIAYMRFSGFDGDFDTTIVQGLQIYPDANARSGFS
jgi:hypothetical protein